MRAQTKALAAALAAALAFTGLQPAAAADASALVGLEEAEYAIDSDNDGLPDDWETEGVVFPDGTELAFEVQPFRKYCLLNGYDDIGLTLRHADKIKAYEAERLAKRPWLANRIV